MTNFIQRAITGFMFILLMGVALIAGPLSYAAVMLCVIVLCTKEFCSMLVTEHSKPHALVVYVVNILAFLLTFLYFWKSIDIRWLLALIPIVWISFFIELFRNRGKEPFLNTSLSFLCEIYIGMPFALFNFLVFKEIGSYDWKPIICLFVMGWVNDTGAYVFGVTLGRHKLYERISPKKTIEGFLGGILATVAASVVIYKSGQFADLPLCIVSALVISIVGTAGDLIESMFKRHANVKDSGRILPGHGGMLDRFDAILFSSPVVSLIYYFFT